MNVLQGWPLSANGLFPGWFMVCPIEVVLYGWPPLLDVAIWGMRERTHSDAQTRSSYTYTCFLSIVRFIFIGNNSCCSPRFRCRGYGTGCDRIGARGGFCLLIRWFCYSPRLSVHLDEAAFKMQHRHPYKKLTRQTAQHFFKHNSKSDPHT